MKNLLTYLILLIAATGCVSDEVIDNVNPLQTELAQPNEFDVLPISNKIRFEFKTEKDSNYLWLASMKINASLFNDSEDTLFFLTSTCYGEQYSLQYDTSYFEFFNLVNCNVNNPETEVIAPNGKHEFTTYIRIKKDTSVIKIGFDFYQVNKFLNIKEISSTNIHHRPTSEQNVIWFEHKLN